MSSQIKETCCDGILASLSKMLQTVCSFFKFPFRVGTCFSCYVMIHCSQVPMVAMKQIANKPSVLQPSKQAN